MMIMDLSVAQKLIDGQTSLFWFRRDLRLNDNAGLYHALKNNPAVIPLFIFDSEILNKLEEPHDKRVQFIHNCICSLQKELEALGSTLLVIHGNPAEIFKKLEPNAVYTNHDYEPYARSRDKKVAAILKRKAIPFYTFKDQVIFEKDEVTKDDGTPYTIFTPYSRKWKEKLNTFFLKSYPVKKYIGNFKKLKHVEIPSLEEIGFESVHADFPPRIIKSSIIENYHKTRDYPALSGTSRLSVHLRFGTVSIRKLVSLAKQKNITWLNELIWREFYHMILWHFPQVESKCFKSAYEHVAWRNNSDEFEAWCMGRTGYPIVDAGMRELNETGFMHNRVRMITASFLTKHLLIDWRWGEAYFAKKLLDYDMAANNGGWQWAAGCGCDAAPYFRVFNPTIQMNKFDPKLKYILKWIPELNAGDYPPPIVGHQHARERILSAYSSALENNR
jgi:deoxyribodipyrimidine photo-lyase